jgi:hypothetical protein
MIAAIRLSFFHSSPASLAGDFHDWRATAAKASPVRHEERACRPSAASDHSAVSTRCALALSGARRRIGLKSPPPATHQPAGAVYRKWSASSVPKALFLAKIRFDKCTLNVYFLFAI